jgi:hypothetical protein
VIVNLVAFSSSLHDVGGQIFALFVIAVAAAEVGIGLAIVILIYRNRETINVDEVNLLHDHLVDLLLEARAQGTARDGEGDRHAHSSTLDLDAPNHVELDHGALQLRVDDSLEGLHDGVPVGHADLGYQRVHLADSGA